MILQKYLDQIEQYIPQHEKRNEEVSQVTVAWQLDHSLNVLIQVSNALKQSNPERYQARINFRYEILNLLHWIPRGKGKSPKTVLPEGTITEQSLKEKLRLAKQKLSEIPSLDQNSFFPHPFFGHIKKKRAIRFLGMHSQHHLKIVRDILE